MAPFAGKTKAMRSAIALQKMSLETILSQIGRVKLSISGSTTALIAAQLGAAMARMALSVSMEHGQNNDFAIERLDAAVVRIGEAAERDRAASSKLIDIHRQKPDANSRRSILRDATQEPLSAANLIVDVLEDLEEAEHGLQQSVASDFFGGIELLSGAFFSVIMAVEANLKRKDGDMLTERTRQTRSRLRARHDLVMRELRSRCEVYHLLLPTRNAAN